MSDSEAPTKSSAPLPDAATEPTTPGRRALQSLTGLPGLLVFSLLLAILIKSFLVQAFVIPSASMKPTLMVGDRVLVNRVATHLHPPVRQQVIVFSDPNAPPQSRSLVPAFVHWLENGLGFASTEDFIKRVIGLPGETVEIRNHQVYIDGKPLAEPYLTPRARQSMTNFPPTRVLPGHLFVMGDNRGNSDDSRAGLGQVPISNVIGHAFVKIWPPSRIGLLR